MRKTKSILLCAAALLLAASCYRDKGNYDYGDIGEAVVSIAEVDDSDGRVVYDQFQMMALSPVLTDKAGNGVAEADYDYEWGLIDMAQSNSGGDEFTPKTVIGTAKDLAYEIHQAPGDYRVTFAAKNRATGAVTDYGFDLEVANMNGWLLLVDEGGDRGDLSIIRDGQIIPGLNADKHGVTHALFSSMNGRKIEKPRLLGWRSNTQSNYIPLSRIFVFTENGVYALGEKTYTVLSDDYSSMFSVQPSAYKPQAQFVRGPAFGQVEMLLNNNNLYVITWSTMGSTGVFANPISGGVTPWVFEPFLAPMPMAATDVKGVLFNKTQFPDGSFMLAVPAQVAVPVASPASPIFNAGQIGRQFDLVGLGTVNVKETGAIFRDSDNGNKLWLYHADFSEIGAPTPLGKYDLSGLPGIGAATNFYFGFRGRVLYYASGNKVYSWLIGGDNATEILSLAAGETVTAIEHYINPDNEAWHGKLLFVATWDGTGGKVYKMPVNELSGVVNGTVETFGGLGRVVDMLLKL
jgi:hypothetical protein